MHPAFRDGFEKCAALGFRTPPMPRPFQGTRLGAQMRQGISATNQALKGVSSKVTGAPKPPAVGGSTRGASG